MNVEKKVLELEKRVIFLERNSSTKPLIKTGSVNWIILGIVYDNPGLMTDELAAIFCQRIDYNKPKMVNFNNSLHRLAHRNVLFQENNKWYIVPSRMSFALKVLNIKQ